MRKYILFLFLILLSSHISFAQPPHTFTQYTSENGLSQKTIQCILQDHKGFMWFATWDGLYKFDGYTFKNYKAYPGDNIELSNNRIGYLQEDLYGYIWVQSYDHKVYRFNPEQEQFQSIPYNNYLSQNIYILPSGDVWISTTHNELIHISTNPVTHVMTSVNFSKQHQIAGSGQINKVYQDNNLNQWILTENGLYKINHTQEGKQLSSYFTSSFNGGKKAFYDVVESEQNLYFSSGDGNIQLHNKNQFVPIKLSTNSSLRFLRLLAKDKLFIGTSNDGFLIYDIKSNNTRHYSKDTNQNMRDNHIKDVYIDKYNMIWLKLNTPGVTLFNPKEELISNFILHDKHGEEITESRKDMDICEDINGSLWIHPAGGGFAWYDRKNNQLKPFYNSSLQTGWNSDNRVASAFSDRQGNLWLCSFRNGLEKITFNTNNFHLQPIQPNDPEYPGNNIRATYQDRDGYIWVGSKDKIIRIYDKNLKYLGNLTSQGNISKNRADELGMAYAFLQDHEGTIWIGTKGKGLIAASPQGSSLKYSLQLHTFNNKDKYSISGNEVYSLHEDSQKRLWIATYEGGINYLDLSIIDRKKHRFINHRNHLKNYPIEQCYRTRFITSDTKGKIWIGSADGLLMCNNANSSPEEIKFNRFCRIPGNKYSLSNNDVHNIFFNKKQDMYITTFGGGLCKLLSLEGNHARFESYTTKNGLPSDVLLSVEEDEKGYLWLSTEEGLCKFEPSSKKITNYQSKFLPQNIKFNEGSALRTQDGKLIFGTVKGILYFSPDSIQNSDYVPPIFFTDFQLSEKRTKSKASTVLTANIDYSQLIKLPHDQNGFNIKFAALDLKNPSSILYAYRLDGFEDKWNYVGNQRSATYTNLPKGKYVLKVRSTNSDGVWMENTHNLNIVVLPSFWETPWAYLLYVLAGIFVIFTASYILFTIFRLKHKVTIEQQISDLKLQFFTNISHDLRTPLTLITGPVEQILQNDNLKKNDKELLFLVKRNTNRMLHLVNQILDFRKIQNKKMKMRVQQIDLIRFVQNVMESFNYLADEHQIDFCLETQACVLHIWADADKLEKILFNLLSNAFKYTPQGKQIKVIVKDSGIGVKISVEDQGIGIPIDKQKSLFNRFENIIDRNLFNQASTGIGLSLVKELIEMHHGTINFNSTEGEGSQFLVHFIKGKEHFDEDTEFILTDYTIPNFEQTHPESSLSLVADDKLDNISKEKETLLIVEDNSELRFFLRSAFDQYFNIIEAENGNIGFKKSKEFLPDIIISDIMMPEKDGIEMTDDLRKDVTTSHIPIVLLTAKSTIESKIKGMEFGADDYITKPFSFTYLRARIFNLLEQRKKLQTLYSASLRPFVTRPGNSINEEIGSPLTLKLSPNDEKFMDRIMAYIEKNIDNGDIKIEDIAIEVNMSRSVFFKKLKTLTGLSPIELLKDIRMKQAAQLIETDEYTMSQISYMVGINDPHYFSKCFKQQYGISPTEYKEKRLE